MERKLPDDILAWLRRTIPRLTAEEMLTALRELIGLFLYADDILGNPIGQREWIACDRIVKESTKAIDTFKGCNEED